MLTEAIYIQQSQYEDPNLNNEFNELTLIIDQLNMIITDLQDRLKIQEAKP